MDTERCPLCGGPMLETQSINDGTEPYMECQACGYVKEREL